MKFIYVLFGAGLITYVGCKIAAHYLGVAS